jgi:alkylation response protein AidB-like acyl-CoA dehydrogenase
MSPVDSPAESHAESPAESPAEMPDLLYSDVEDDVRSTLGAMLGDASSWSDVLATVEDDDPAPSGLWRRVAVDLGLAGLAVPEEHGGAGASWREVAVVLEELGRTVAPVPYATSSVFATAVLLAVEGHDALVQLASGASVAAVVVPVTAPSFDLRADVHVADGRLTGFVPLVAGALEADVLIVPASDGLFLVDADEVERTAVDTLDMTRRLADIHLRDAPGRLLAADAQPATAWAGAVTSAMLASEQLGLAEWCLAQTVGYLKERRQFGRTLASFQALKHRLADLWTEVNQARAAARYAAAVASGATVAEPGDLPVAASLAQVVCSRVALRAAEECVQMHGGIGFTWEHPAHLYLKRARVDAMTLGSPSAHLRRIGVLVDLTADREGQRA